MRYLSLRICNEDRFHNHLVYERMLNHLVVLETHKIHLPFLCKR